MAGDIEAIGDAITAGLVASAIGPGSEGTGNSASRVCLNCGETLIGRHCHRCGQSAHIHRTLAAFWHDFTHSILHFEGKIWRTVPLLFFRPGKLTRRYIHGERVRFVSPLALFLFSVFLMFAVFGWVGAPFDPEHGVDRASVAINTPQVEQELTLVQSRIKSLESKRAVAAAAGHDVAAIDSRLKGLRASENGLKAGRDLSIGLESGEYDFSDAAIGTGNKVLDAKIAAALKNPALLLYKMQSSAYKYSWALIPLSLPFLWIIFAWRRQFKLYDHAVFITYSLAFATLLFVVLAILDAVGLGAGALQWVFFIIPVHMFMQIKEAYEISVRGALWRTGFLVVAAALVLSIFALLLLALGVAG